MIRRVAMTLVVAASLACAATAKQATTDVQGLPDDQFFAGAYKASEPGIVQPNLKSTAMPRYTRQAMQQKIQGTVIVDAVVMPDGTVGRARVQRSLDKTYGLDQAAIEAANKWTFEPGMKDGKPVPVAVVIELEFRLH